MKIENRAKNQQKNATMEQALDPGSTSTKITHKKPTTGNPA